MILVASIERGLMHVRLPSIGKGSGSGGNATPPGPDHVTWPAVVMISLLVSLMVSSTARSQHLDRVKLDAAISEADRIVRTDPRPFFKNVRSVLVYADTGTIFEQYYGGMTRDSLSHLQSQTKSVVALLMGIVIDKGFVQGDHEFVRDYFPEYFSPAESLKSSLRIRDLLTMSAGFAWEEMIPQDDPENDNMNMYRSDNYLQYVLSKSVVVAPFTSFEYNSGCPMIVAGIIERASHMSLEQFAEEYLFEPLHISTWYWIKDSTGFCHAGGGLYLTPSDMLKIGILVMDHGSWEGHQIVSESWIDVMTRPYFPTGCDVSRYGYYWWVREMTRPDGSTTMVVSAEGAGGQKLYVFPGYRLVVLFTERNYSTPQVSPIFIRESVLPLLQ